MPSGQSCTASTDNNVKEKENPTVTDGKVPQKGARVASKLFDDDREQEATINGRAGRATGRNKFWFNIQKEDKPLESLNFEALEHWKELPTEEVLLYGVSDQVDVKEAKLREFQSWFDHSVYVEFPNDGQKYISTRWVLTEKFVNGNKTTKARLVASGFEEDHLAKLRTDSPTCGKESLQIVIAIIITNGWEINSLDIKSAFLQGKEISRDLFVKPPKEAKTDNFWKLLKTVHGLNDASRTCYLRVTDEFIICGACFSKYDEAIFYWHYKNTLQSSYMCSPQEVPN